jgi:hypothetical protein
VSTSKMAHEIPLDPVSMDYGLVSD